MREAALSAGPFLRWAGGKRWLLREVPTLLGSFAVGRYHEPFLGGGSMFFGFAPPGWSYLSDLNEELIETYEVVRDHPEAVGARLDRHPNSLSHYYKIRDENPSDPVERAARFVYLNHTSFNGIYRVNLDGRYNVPYGNRESTNTPTPDDLRAVARRLKRVTFGRGDFASVLDNVRSGDFVFLDPPYTVAHNLNGFIKYNHKLFSFEDQRRLRGVIDEIRSRDAYYLLTNAAHDSISKLFTIRGDRRLTLTRRNVIGGKNADRGRATELVFTNVVAR